MNAGDAQTGTGNARVHSSARRMHLQNEAAKLDGRGWPMKRLTATLRAQPVKAARLDAAVAANLKELGYDG